MLREIQLWKKKYQEMHSQTFLRFNLNRQTLAVWFMDKGLIFLSFYLFIFLSFYLFIFSKSKKSIFLDCTDFDISIVQHFLNKNFSLKTWFHKKGKKSTRLFVAKDSASTFKSVVSPYIFKTMEYKQRKR